MEVINETGRSKSLASTDDSDDIEQWRIQYGANGATVPPGPPRTTYVIRVNPMRYSGGEGGVRGNSLLRETCGYHGEPVTRSLCHSWAILVHNSNRRQHCVSRLKNTPNWLRSSSVQRSVLSTVLIPKQNGAYICFPSILLWHGSNINVEVNSACSAFTLLVGLRVIQWRSTVIRQTRPHQQADFVGLYRYRSKKTAQKKNHERKRFRVNHSPKRNFRDVLN